MGFREARYSVPPLLAVADGATTPDPGGPSWAWSTILGSPVYWTGANWRAVSHLAVGATAPANPAVGSLWVDPNADGNDHLDYLALTSLDPNGVTDASSAIANAMDQAVAEGHGNLLLPALVSDTSYKLDVKVDIPPGMRRIFTRGKVKLRKSAADTGLYRRVIFNAGGDLSNFGIYGLGFATSQVAASDPTGVINLDNWNFENIALRGCTFDTAGDGANALLLKCASGKTIKGVDVSGNVVLGCGRIAFEVVNHDNTAYTVEDVSITRNLIAGFALMGISLSGRIKSAEAVRNRIAGGSTSVIGIEVCEVDGVLIGYNRLTGQFLDLFQASSAYPNVTNGLSFVGNRTFDGRVTGGLFFAKASKPLISDNHLSITKWVELSGTSCSDGTLTANEIESNGFYALLMDGSPGHVVQNNGLSNEAAGTNYSTVRANGSNATGIRLIDNDIRKGSGGGYVDTASGGSFADMAGNWHDGLRQNNEVPLGVQLFRQQAFPGGTTSTCTITLPTVGYWMEFVVEVTVGACDNGGGNAGGASRTIVARHYTGAGTDITVDNSNFTSANLSLAASGGTNTLVLTSTASASGLPTTWGIRVTHPTGRVTVAFS